MAKRTKKLYIWEEIIIQILQHLPVKSLMRFKRVSKEWLRLIQDSYFAGCHRVSSHTRPGGIQILSEVDHDYEEVRSCFLWDPEGNSQSGLIELPKTFPKDMNRISYTEGLICFGSRVWNPSTREIFYLPTAKHRLDRVVDKRYLLGFDDFHNEYKVLCCWTCKSEKIKSKELSDQVPVFQVLTLGDGSWKHILDFPEVLNQGFEILSSRSFSNMIFCLIRCGNKPIYGILTFDVVHELVGFISFPYTCRDTHVSRINLIEIEGSLAFDDIGPTLWILNHTTARWMKFEVPIDGCMNIPFRDCSSGDGDYVISRLIPLSTIHTNEILFQCNVEEKGREKSGSLLKYFYYDLKSGTFRFVHELEKTVEGKWKYLIIKHLDTIITVKPQKQNDEKDSIIILQ